MTFDFFNTVDAVNFITVDTLIDENDGDLSLGDISIREAVSAANASEIPYIIFFSEDLKNKTIELSMGELVLNGSILVDGDLDDDQQPDIRINAASESRVFHIQGPNVALDGLEIFGGEILGDGAGVYAKGALDIANSTIGENFSFGGKGGGIAVVNADVRLLNSTIQSNFSNTGGGLYIESGTAYIDDSQFFENQADNGAGIYSSDTAVLDVLNSNVDNNQAEISGGGIFNAGEGRVAKTSLTQNYGRTRGGGITNSGILRVTESLLERNEADFFGAGIENTVNGTLSVANSVISDNLVDYSGGGINSGTGPEQPVILTRSSIINNTSGEIGGGLSGQFEITDSSIIGNVANTFGGGLNGGGSLSNTLVSGNTATLSGGGIEAGLLDIASSTISDNTLVDNFFQGAGISVVDTVSLANSIVSGSVGGNDIQVSESGRLETNGVNLVEDGSVANDNIVILDPQLGEVLDNGGSVLSQALLPGSPAIDAGDNRFVTTTFDQRGPGFNRVADGDGDGVATVDLGAVETEPIAASPNTFFTLKKAMSFQGMKVNNQDILRYDGRRFTKVFNGASLGLEKIGIDALDVLSENVFLLSFKKEQIIDGLGYVDDSDIIKFTATTLGERTTGVFEHYFDGSDVGLDENEEDVDSVTGIANGDLIVSTKAAFQVSGIKGKKGDLLRFSPTRLGDETSGSWSLYFDMSDTELGQQNIDAVDIRDDGEILFSTSGRYEVGGIRRANDDVFGFNSSTLGEETSGSLNSVPTFDGSEFGLLSNSIGAFSVV